ncbi:DUF4193 family protein [Arthrobacter rhombi]
MLAVRARAPWCSSITVRPSAQAEFTCGECFLMRYRSQLSREKNDVKIC